MVGEATQLQPELLEKSYVEPEKKTSGSADRTNRTGKIYYQMNFLSSMSEQDGMLMRALCESQELQIFRSDLIIDLIDFRWDCFAAKIQKIGFFFHLLFPIF